MSIPLHASLKDVCVAPGCTLREAIACIDRSAKGIVLVTDAARKLVGTITDGDIRRAVLAGVSLDSPVDAILARKQGAPVTARVGADRGRLLRTMQEKWIRQIPLLDDQGRVADLVTIDDLLPEQVLPLQAVIMAGGQGTRLRPLTGDTPKPMLQVGDKPLMEHIVDQLRDAGIQHVSVSTFYLADKIKDHFGNGRAFGVDLSYVQEDQPLGTAGALSLMKPSDEPILVINGDILTKVDFRAMLAYHREQKADMTVAVKKYEMSVPFGVVEADGSAMIRNLAEKPVYSFLVNAGIYLIEPPMRQYVQAGKRFDMTDLIRTLIEKGQRVVSFPILEYWLDVGQMDDYRKAQRDSKSWEDKAK